MGGGDKESISPTFYEHNCANFLAQVKNLTFTSSTKTHSAKLSYEKAAHKMLMQLTQSVEHTSWNTLFKAFGNEKLCLTAKLGIKWYSLSYSENKD